MRSIPSNSEPDAGQPLTRRLQNWKWPRREPVPAVMGLTEPKPICLSTVVLGDVILDFEAVIIVIAGQRMFLKVSHFWIAAALLFAEGHEVSISTLLAIRNGAVLPRARSVISRDIRTMRATVFGRDPRIRVTATGRGYRLTWDAQTGV